MGSVTPAIKEVTAAVIRTGLISHGSRASGLVHGQAGTDQTKHLGDATSVPDDGLAQHGNGRIRDLSVVDVAGTLQHLTAHGGSAAQRGVQERGVDQVVQTGWGSADAPACRR